MSVLRFDHAYVALRDHPVLHDVSLALTPGLTGLIGPNGSGKSTLIRAAAGLLPLQKGAVFIQENDLTALTLRARADTISYLPQNGPVHWPLRVDELVALGCTHLGKSKTEIDEMVAETLDACAIAGFAARSVNTLSGGERQRVLLARALVANTPVLLADEPTAALDPWQQHQIMGLLANVAAKGKAVLCAVHDLPLAARYCRRLVLLDGGKITDDGAPKTVLAGKAACNAYGLRISAKGHVDEKGLPEARAHD